MDELLVKKAKKGDKNSFTKLILEIKDQAYEIAYCYLHNKEDSIDAVSNAVEKGLKNVKKLKNPQYFKTWFIRIVINECKLELRSRKKITKLKENLIYDKLTVDNITDNYELEDIINKLPEPNREMIYLKYYMGYTLEEISEILDVPIGTVKTKIYSTIKNLKKEFD